MHFISVLGFPHKQQTPILVTKSERELIGRISRWGVEAHMIMRKLVAQALGHESHDLRETTKGRIKE